MTMARPPCWRMQWRRFRPWLGQLCEALQKTAGSGSFAVESTQVLPEDIDPNFGAPIATLRYTGDDGESALLPINFSGSALFFNP